MYQQPAKLDDKMKGFQVGAVDFISKPFDYSEVAMRVNTFKNVSDEAGTSEDSNHQD